MYTALGDLMAMINRHRYARLSGNERDGSDKHHQFLMSPYQYILSTVCNDVYIIVTNVLNRSFPVKWKETDF